TAVSPCYNRPQPLQFARPLVGSFPMVGRRIHLFCVTGHGLVLGIERRLWILSFHFGLSFLFDHRPNSELRRMFQDKTLVVPATKTIWGYLSPLQRGRGTHRRFLL